MRQLKEGFYWVLFAGGDLDIAYWLSAGLWRRSTLAQHQLDDQSLLVLSDQLMPPAIPDSPTGALLAAVGALSPDDLAELSASKSPALRALAQQASANALTPSIDFSPVQAGLP